MTNCACYVKLPLASLSFAKMSDNRSVLDFLVSIKQHLREYIGENKILS